MSHSIFLCLMVFAVTETLGRKVCVRNYVGASFSGGCNFSTQHVRVNHITDETKVVCARKYLPFYCNRVDEYEWIRATNGEEICILNYHQPPVAKLCESWPQIYDWVQAD